MLSLNYNFTAQPKTGYEEHAESVKQKNKLFKVLFYSKRAWHILGRFF